MCQGEDVLLALGTDEEGRAVAACGGEVRHAAAFELLGDLVAKPLAGEAVARHGEQRGVLPVGLEPEGGHTTRGLAVVEAVVLKTGAAFAALVNFGQAGIALLLGLGLDMSAEQQALWMLLIEGAVALVVVRPQVTAPISSLRIEQSSVVKAA